MNPFAQSVFSMTAPCLPCCEQPVPGCACALLIPIFSTPYADYESAESDITDYTADCYLYGYKEISTGTSSLDSFNVDAITPTSFSYYAKAFAVYDPGPGIYKAATIDTWTSVSLVDGDTLEIAFTAGASLPGPWYGDIQVYVYDCNGVELESFYAPEEDEPTPGPTSGTFNFTVPADGVYYIYVGSGASDFTTGETGSSYTEVDVEFTATALTPNPVIAYYDSGDVDNPYRLEACPKLLLPILTESTGSWYADLTEAEAVLADALAVSNCVGYFQNGTAVDTVTATDGGTDLTLAASGTEINGPEMWGSVNLEAGETVTITGSSDGGTFNINAIIYDDEGVLVEDFSTTGSTTATSAAVPYTGRYTIMTEIVTPPPGTPPDNISAVITSSGTLSVNPIQVLYDVGLQCPARLDCVIP